MDPPAATPRQEGPSTPPPQLAAPSPRTSNVSIHSLMSPARPSHSRDSSVSDKISVFNTLAAQGNKPERTSHDAALKRAVLGREEAEAEARRYKDDLRALRKQLDDGRDRERRVGERLETVMVRKPRPRLLVTADMSFVLQENYGRAKETHAHTQALWEKEIRRTRKETFKSQSVIVKLQEELKAARAAHKSSEETLLREKERSLNREQEAFQARYSLVGLQDQLDKTRAELEQALDRLKVVEQERDAFKTLAKTDEDVARIAAEGMLPLPSTSEKDDEFATPRKPSGSRVSSLSLTDIKSSEASEAKIEELTRLWQWEKQRASRASDQIEYLEAECRLHACSCMKKRPRSSMGLLSPKRQKRSEPAPLADPSDRMILSEMTTIPPPRDDTLAHSSVPQLPPPKTNHNKKTDHHKEERRATIFLPDLGTFQTVSVQEADTVDRPMEDVPAPVQEELEVPILPERYTRTPSVEPPSFAMLHPSQQEHEEPMDVRDTAVPTTPGAMPALEGRKPSHSYRAPLRAQDPNVERHHQEYSHFKTSFNSRPHTTSSFYHESTTTTTIPLREESEEPTMAKQLLALQRTPSRASGRVADDEGPTWDVNNPALTPTMTREQALAKIRERRGRTKSGTAATPRKMMRGVERRDMSAPAGRKGRIGS